MNKMRFKQVKGDPAGFKLFLRQNNIKSSIIVCYVGNRFHVMFHQAGVLYYLQEKLLMYLENVCNSKTTLRTALIKDLRNNKILLQLRALGLIGKLVTGPWMHQLYTNQAITNLESRRLFRKHEANDVKCSELGWLCIPLVVESYGAWGKEAIESFSSLASRLAITSSRPKSAVLSELYGRLNLNLVRGL